MPVCIKCSTDNPGGTKYCGKCGAVLPQMAPTGMESTSSLDLDENTEYLHPLSHHPAEELLNLAWAANDFLDEGDEIEPFLEAYEIVKNKFLTYQRDYMEQMQESITNDRAREPEAPYPKQLAYLHTKAVNLANEGLAMVDGFLAALDEERVLPQQLKDGVVKLVQANDHFCVAYSLIEARVKGITEALGKAGITVGEDGELKAGPIPGGFESSPAAAESEPATEGAEAEGAEEEEEE